MSKIIPNFSRQTFLDDSGYYHYMEGFTESEDKYKEIIEHLLDALERRHADDFVDAFREEYEL